MRRVGRPPLGDEPRQLIAIRMDTKVLEELRKEACRRRVGYQTLWAKTARRRACSALRDTSLALIAVPGSYQPSSRLNFQQAAGHRRAGRVAAPLSYSKIFERPSVRANETYKWSRELVASDVALPIMAWSGTVASYGRSATG